jgi:HK97 gp10 family phage protein
VSIGRRQTINIKGLPDLEKKLLKMPVVVKAASGRAVRDETDETRDDAKRFAPVKTGELRESIQGEYDEKLIRGRVAATAKHAGFVEHGTEDTPEQPFMTPAAEMSRRRFPKRVRAEVKVELEHL